MLCRGQLVTVGNRVIDISIPSVKAVMDMTQGQRDCLQRVMALFREHLRGQDES